VFVTDQLMPQASTTTMNRAAALAGDNDWFTAESLQAIPFVNRIALALSKGSDRIDQGSQIDPRRIARAEAVGRCRVGCAADRAAARADGERPDQERGCAAVEPQPVGRARCLAQHRDACL